MLAKLYSSVRDGMTRETPIRTLTYGASRSSAYDIEKLHFTRYIEWSYTTRVQKHNITREHMLTMVKNIVHAFAQTLFSHVVLVY